MSRFFASPSLLSLAVAGLALLPAPALAQEDDFRTGTHVLRRLLYERKFTALSQWQQVLDNPDLTLLILLGKPADDQGRSRWQVPGGLAAFVENGGAVLLATDHAVRNNEVRQVFGYVPAGDRVSAWPPDELHMRFRPGFKDSIDGKFIYRGRAAGLRDCIILEPTAEKVPPLFQDNKLGVVTNRASSLQATGGARGGRILAQFPGGAWYTRFGRFDRLALPQPFAVSREAGRSRLLMLSDHSVFINEMLLQEDNGNLDFAYDAIEWLRDQRRDRVLIVEDGEIQSELDIPLREDDQALRKLLRALSRQANKVLLGVQTRHQQEHHLDELMIEGINRGTGWFPFGRNRPENYYLLLITLAAGGLVLFGLSRLVRSSHRAGLAPVFASFGNRPRATVSSLALRERSALAADDLREYAREAIREWFAAIPGCPAGERGAKPPRVDAAGGWWRRFRLRGQVRALWRLAGGASMSRMSEAEFRKLLVRLGALRKAIDSGGLRIEW